jgi:hypothetical protein
LADFEAAFGETVEAMEPELVRFLARQR